MLGRSLYGRGWKPLALCGLVVLAGLVGWWLYPSTGAGELPEVVEFNRHIRPILSNRCFACHGPDGAAREGDLRLDLRESATGQREEYEHRAIVPGAPGRSELVRRIRSSDPDEMMPPPESGKTLSAREAALLERWIDQGAEWQPHWAYIPPERTPLPETELGAPFVRNAVDRFVVARLERERLQPSAEADRVTLLRRLYFDLLGLPPPPEAVDAFLADASPEAYERVVDRLLEDPHYGERMAMLWLDLVRFADTDGYHSDLHRPIHAYRDYVIRAFNRNTPFDQFTREQIAGDLLPYATLEQQIASAFNRLGQATKEGGAQPKEYLAKYAGDRVRTVSMTWMGSTVGCAECHDHKFDPFTAQDFYSMAAFFADVQERGVYRNSNALPPEMVVADRERARRLAELDRQIDRMRRTANTAGALEGLRQKGELLAALPRTLVTESVEPRVTRLLPRGNWADDSGPIVTPDTPEFLPALDVEGRRPTRMDLADWLVARDNPLTARVFVNHLWARYFGTGLSRVLDDLGSQGEWPTHPELLDWLAVEFMESGWDVKHMVRLLVTSATYRQSSKPTPEVRASDPDNRLLARQSRFRLQAEVVRDNALAVSGLLTRRIGGPSVKPYQPEGYWSDIRTFGTEGPASAWAASEGADQYRRGLYTYWKRSFVHPSMLAFDAPDRQECTARRPRSNTPLQALVLLNDPTYVEAARVFAQRIVASGGGVPAERIRSAFRRALSRDPEPEEIRELERLLEEERAAYAERPEEARRLLAVGTYPAPDAAEAAEVAAWTGVARALFNLNEFITRY